jgi:HK97 family phage prohead protease
MPIENEYKVKTLGLEVKDVDVQTRRVKVALSAFNNIDSDGDIIRFGAFRKSIEERGPNSTSSRKIAFLRHHDWEHQLGTWQSLEETHDHLIGVADLGRNQKAVDAMLDYQDGLINEHSIGFNFITDKMTFTEVNGQTIREASEVFLWEGSAVLFGANSLTPTIDVSKGNHTEILATINKQMEGLITALKHGKGSDERLFTYEMQLKVIQEKYNSLIELKQPLEEGTAEIIKPNSQEKTLNNDLINFYNNLK